MSGKCEKCLEAEQRIASIKADLKELTSLILQVVDMCEPRIDPNIRSRLAAYQGGMP